MRHACRVAAEVLIETGAAVAPGVTTDQLDAVAHDAYVARGAYPSTLGLPRLSQVDLHVGQRGRVPRHPRRPAAASTATSSTSTSPPTSTACTATPRPPSSSAIPTPDAPTAARRHHPRGDAGRHRGPSPRVARIATSAGPSSPSPSPRPRCGPRLRRPRHRVGVPCRAAHHPRRRADATALVLAPGMTFTVEPMLTAGTHRHVAVERRLDRGRPTTSCPSAQFEHTVTVTDDGVEILTVTADGEHRRGVAERPALRAVYRLKRRSTRRRTARGGDGGGPGDGRRWPGTDSMSWIHGQVPVGSW